jgi:hypothetical protein
MREPIVGEFADGVLLELVKDHGISRPRMRPISEFPEDMRVEVSRQLRETFPLGTQFETQVKVCQKHHGSKPHGPPYLKVYEIGVVVSSINDKGLVAKLDPSGADGRKYYYIYE